MTKKGDMSLAKSLFSFIWKVSFVVKDCLCEVVRNVEINLPERFSEKYGKRWLVVITCCLILLLFSGFNYAKDQNPIEWPYGGVVDSLSDSREAPIIFKNEVDYKRSIFSEKANYFESHFCNKADFEQSTFVDDADYRNSVFENSVNFSSAKFKKYSLFKRVQFKDKVNFKNATYFDDAEFSEHVIYADSVEYNFARFEKNAFFKNAQFKRNVNFIGTCFRDNTDFKQVKFDENANFSEAKFYGNVYFEGCQITKEIDFAGTIFENVLDLRRIDFEKKGVIVVDHNTSFPNGKLYASWEQMKGRFRIDINSCTKYYKKWYDCKDNDCKIFLNDSLNNEKYELTELFYK